MSLVSGGGAMATLTFFKLLPHLLVENMASRWVKLKSAVRNFSRILRPGANVIQLFMAISDDFS
jgi:hypothetical protein